MQLRVWWRIPQFPCPIFHVPVRTLREARLLLTTLADYDAFQITHLIKPDYYNAGGLEVFDPTDDHDSPDGSWCDWTSTDAESFVELTDEQIDALDAA